METTHLYIDIFGNNYNQIKQKRILQLISISLLTLSVILSCKLLILLLFPDISPRYYELTIILSSCLAVNIGASLILYKYQRIIEILEDRLGIKTDNFHNAIKIIKEEREDRRRCAIDCRLSEEKYRRLADHVSEGILILDTAGNFLEANEKMEELLGVSEAELLSMNLEQILPKEEREKSWTALGEAVRKGESNLANGWIIGKNHQRVPVDFVGHKLEYAGKTIIQGIFRDLRAWRGAENSAGHEDNINPI